MIILRMWRDDANGIRPKWGIYRSLLSQEQLRDEELLFADFSIEEVVSPSAALAKNQIQDDTVIYPNPVYKVINIGIKEKWDVILITDSLNKKVMKKNR